MNRTWGSGSSGTENALKRHLLGNMDIATCCSESEDFSEFFDIIFLNKDCGNDCLCNVCILHKLWSCLFRKYIALLCRMAIGFCNSID